MASSHSPDSLSKRVQAFHDESLLALGIRRSTSLTRHAIAHTAAVAELGDGVTGQDGGIGQIGLVQLNQAGESDGGVGDDLLDGVFAALGVKMPKGLVGVLSDGREHFQERLLPVRDRRLSTKYGFCSVQSSGRISLEDGTARRGRSCESRTQPPRLREVR